MQSEKVLDRLNNPPIIDGRKKPIDLGDMADDMDREMIKAAIYDIVEETLKEYDDGNLKSKAFRHEMSKMLFRKIDAFYNFELYTKPQIKEAVDIAIGDDGLRSKEVLEILIDKEPTTADEFNAELFEENEKRLIEEQKNE